jgi:hypothetical protein
MYSITENIYYSRLSSVAILLQPEPVSHRIIQGNDRVLSPCVLSSCGLPLPPTCLLVTVNEARSYFASTVGIKSFKRPGSDTAWATEHTLFSNVYKLVDSYMFYGRMYVLLFTSLHTDVANPFCFPFFGLRTSLIISIQFMDDVIFHSLKIFIPSLSYVVPQWCYHFNYMFLVSVEYLESSSGLYDLVWARKTLLARPCLYRFCYKTSRYKNEAHVHMSFYFHCCHPLYRCFLLQNGEL